jgi:hypothetical protein
MQEVIDLLGKNVNFIRNIKLKQDFISENIKGMVTDVVLSLDGNHQISVEHGDFFVLSDLLEFQVLS